MSNRLLDEAELLLLSQWDEARMLEQTMGRVREKYDGLCNQAVQAVREGHPELDACRVFATQFWAKGWLAFGRKAWPDGEAQYPTGFYLDNLRLEVLADEGEPAPTATIWMPAKASKKIGQEVAAVRQQLADGAADLLTKDEQERYLRPEGGKAILRFAMPSKAELLNLIKTGDGTGFVELVVTQVDLMARFLPLLDPIFVGPTGTPR